VYNISADLVGEAHFEVGNLRHTLEARELDDHKCMSVVVAVT
jgi:hypothetical protein